MVFKVGPLQRLEGKSFVPTDHPDYEKDEDTGAIINKNMGAFEEFKAKRERGKEFLQLRNDVEALKHEVAGLKKIINGA